MNLSKEQSEAQAITLKSIQALMMTLDVEYLRECHKQMSNQNSWRESAMILDPQPHTALERNDLNILKTKQLEHYLDAAENLQKISDAEMKLAQSKRNSNRLEDFFR